MPLWLGIHFVCDARRRFAFVGLRESVRSGLYQLENAERVPLDKRPMESRESAVIFEVHSGSPL